jgi:hypothetical protein
MEKKNIETREIERVGVAYGKIIAPPKVKHLLWKIYKECLPTRMRLRNPYVQCPVNVSYVKLKAKKNGIYYLSVILKIHSRKHSRIDF